MKVTLAHYAFNKIARSIAALTIFLVLAAWLIGFSYRGLFIDRIHAQGGVWVPMLLVSLLAVGYAFLIELLLIKQAFFDKRRALWINNGKLIFLSSFYFRRNCSEISAVAPATYGARGRKSILISFRGGEEKHIPTGALQETQQEILNGLASALELSH